MADAPDPPSAFAWARLARITLNVCTCPCCGRSFLFPSLLSLIPPVSARACAPATPRAPPAWPYRTRRPMTHLVRCRRQHLVLRRQAKQLRGGLGVLPRTLHPGPSPQGPCPPAAVLGASTSLSLASLPTLFAFHRMLFSAARSFPFILFGLSLAARARSFSSRTRPSALPTVLLRAASSPASFAHAPHLRSTSTASTRNCHSNPPTLRRFGVPARSRSGIPFAQRVLTSPPSSRSTLRPCSCVFPPLCVPSPSPSAYSPEAHVSILGHRPPTHALRTHTWLTGHQGDPVDHHQRYASVSPSARPARPCELTPLTVGEAIMRSHLTKIGLA